MNNNYVLQNKTKHNKNGFTNGIYSGIYNQNEDVFPNRIEDINLNDKIKHYEKYSELNKQRNNSKDKRKILQDKSSEINKNYINITPNIPKKNRFDESYHNNKASDDRIRSLSNNTKIEKSKNKIYVRNKSKNDYETTKNNIFPNQIKDKDKKTKPKKKQKLVNSGEKNNSYSNWNTEPNSLKNYNKINKDNNFLKINRYNIQNSMKYPNEMTKNNYLGKNQEEKTKTKHYDYYLTENQDFKGKKIQIENKKIQSSRSNSVKFARKPSSEWRRGDSSISPQRVHDIKNYTNTNNTENYIDFTQDFINKNKNKNDLENRFNNNTNQFNGQGKYLSFIYFS